MIGFYALADMMQRSWTHLLYAFVYILIFGYKVFSQLMGKNEKVIGEVSILKSTWKYSVIAILLYMYANL